MSKLGNVVVLFVALSFPGGCTPSVDRTDVRSVARAYVERVIAGSETAGRLLMNDPPDVLVKASGTSISGRTGLEAGEIHRKSGKIVGRGERGRELDRYGFDSPPGFQGGLQTFEGAIFVNERFEVRHGDGEVTDVVVSLRWSGAEWVVVPSVRAGESDARSAASD